MYNRHGAKVIIACRNMEKAEEALKKLRSEITEKSPGSVEAMKLDLCDLNSVREFVTEFKKLNIPLHILINNAGNDLFLFI
jgi:NAD(P)-dependent dehydrogenase (short-subunit alcohol dehydrogenase family)